MILRDCIADLQIGHMILVDMGQRIVGRIANICGDCVLLESGWIVRGRDRVLLR